MIQRVISGGQDGADVAGLMAARQCSIQTGGYMPVGFLTLDGPNPDRAKKYGLLEFGNYKDRTFKNVQESDATMRFARDWQSAGEKCTLRAIDLFDKPHLDIPVRDHIEIVPQDEYGRVCTWLRVHDVKVLNIAGNAPDKCPDITDFVCSYLVNLFRRLSAEIC